MSSVKTICIGDPHFKENNIPECIEIIEKTIEYIKNEKPDFVVILGDLLDKHEKYWEKPFNLAMEWLWKLQEICPLFLVIGNHDLCNNMQFLTTAHAFNPCKAWSNITICDNIVIRDIKDMRFTFLPYVPPGRFIEALETSNEVWETSECIFCHQEFSGCTLSGTKISTVGDKWDDSNPRIISGHIHDEQTIAPEDPNDTGYIHYPGALMQANFGEKDNKAMWLCEFEEGSVFTHKKIDLKFPKKIEHRMELDLLNKDFIQELSETRDKHKLKLTATKEEILVFKKSFLLKEINKTKNIIPDYIVIGDNPMLLSNKIDQSIKGNYMQVLEALFKEEDDDELSAIFEQILTM